MNNIFSVAIQNVFLTLMYLFPGWLLGKRKLTKPEHLSTLSAVLVYFCAPCMIINSIMNVDCTAQNTKDMLLFFFVTLALMFIFLTIVDFILKKLKRNQLYTVPSFSVMGNVGFFGLPIVTALVPDHPEVAAYSCIFCVSMNVLAFTYGSYSLTKDTKYISLKQAFINPSILSMLAGFVLYFLRVSTILPEMAGKYLATLTSVTTPLSMIILGVRLSSMNLKKLFTNSIAYLTCLGKLVLFPLFSYFVMSFFPVTNAFLVSILVLCGAPCAALIVNLAEIHGSGQEIAANCVALSTLLSVVTLPLLTLIL